MYGNYFHVIFPDSSDYADVGVRDGTSREALVDSSVPEAVVSRRQTICFGPEMPTVPLRTG